MMNLNHFFNWKTWGLFSDQNCKKAFLINNNNLTKIDIFTITDNFSFLVETMEALQAQNLSL